MKKIYISIINYNRLSDTLSCLDSLELLKKNEYELYVCVFDNASFDPFITKKTYNNFILECFYSKENLGFSGGHNRVITHALEKGADYILLLNNDTQIDTNCLFELINGFESDPSCGITVPKIYFSKGHEFHKDRYKESDKGKVIWYAGGILDYKNIIGFHRGVDEIDNGQYERREQTDYATGCCMLISKEVFEKVGMLNEQFFLYYEDSEYCERVKQGGFKIYYIPQAHVWHNNAGSTGGSGSELQDYFITRNRMFFGMKYAPFRSKIALIKESIRLFINGRKWQKKGIIDFYYGKFGKGSYPL